jgi:hypothetical protein
MVSKFLHANPEKRNLPRQNVYSVNETPMENHRQDAFPPPKGLCQVGYGWDAAYSFWFLIRNK